MKRYNLRVLILTLLLTFSLAGCDEKKKDTQWRQPTTPTTTQPSGPNVGGTPKVAAGGPLDSTGSPTPPCNGDARYIQIASIPCVPKQWAFNYTTPKGVQVFADEDIMTAHKEKAFQMIDFGIDNLLAATGAKFPSWNKATKHSDFRVGFIPPAYDEGRPPYLVAGGMYGTAGTVYGFNNDTYSRETGLPLTIIVPNQNVANWQYTDGGMEGIWFEGEHYREISNDMNEARKYFGTNDSHPHHPMPQGLPTIGYGLTPATQGLVSQPKHSIKCVFNFNQ